MRFRVYILLLALAASGCRARPMSLDSVLLEQASHGVTSAAGADIRELELSAAAAEQRPRSLLDGAPPTYRELTIEEAVRTALAQSPVLRDMGGTLLQSPRNARTIVDAAITEADPRFGVHAALAEFDARLTSSLFVSKNDRAFNNILTAGGTNQFTQDLITSEHELSKITGTGTRFALRKRVEYDANNAPQNLFPSAWTANIDLEARHPLLQGSGVVFNQLAGPDARPGVINGVRVARVDTNVSLLDFELGVRDLLSDVENAYWDLYFAYRRLDAKLAARNRALETWRKYKDRLSTGSAGGDLGNEAQAREQLFRFEMDVQTALNGDAAAGTSNRNGVTGGAFRSPGGVILAERRLRLLMGLPINGSEMLRPSIEPPAARVAFSWDSVLIDALTRRAELRKQRQIVSRRQMQLAANRNFLKPRVDAFARYRVRGFGKQLARDSGGVPFDNAVEELLSGDYQEWQFGIEMDNPIGRRLGHTAVHHSELQVAREKMLLEQQERNVVYDLSNALGELDQSHHVMQVAYNRRIAAAQFLDSLESRFRAGANIDANLLLDAQQRLAEADVRFFEYAVRYALAIKNVHLERGTLLEYNDVVLAGQEASRPAATERVIRPVSPSAPPSGGLQVVPADPTDPRGGPPLGPEVLPPADIPPPPAPASNPSPNAPAAPEVIPPAEIPPPPTARPKVLPPADIPPPPTAAPEDTGLGPQSGASDSALTASNAAPLTRLPAPGPPAPPPPVEVSYEYGPRPVVVPDPLAGRRDVAQRPRSASAQIHDGSSILPRPVVIPHPMAGGSAAVDASTPSASYRRASRVIEQPAQPSGAANSSRREPPSVR